MKRRAAQAAAFAVSLAGTSLLAASGAVLAACSESGSSAAEPPGPSEPPEPPSNVHAEAAARWNQCTLLWTAPPQSVDGYEITTSERGWSFDDGDTHGGIAPGRSTQATLDFSQAAARELTSVDIRIRSRHGGEFSAYSPAVSCVLSVVAPRNVVTTTQSTGIELTWTNNSDIATTIAIEKTELDGNGEPGTWSQIIALPAEHRPFGNKHLDPATAVGKAYGYRVSAVAPGGQRGTSSEVTSLTLGAPLVTTMVELPSANVAITDGRGHYAFARNEFGILSFTWGTGPPWNSSPSISARADAPLVKLDAAGLPHTVYGTRPASGDGAVITHAWSDGTQWREEPIARRTLQGPLVFDLDATGTPVMMWSLGDRGTEAATKVGGVWTVKPLDDLVLRRPFDYTVFADASGATHLLARNGGTITHVQLDNGAWTSEKLPSKDLRASGSLLGTGRDVDHLVVCFDTYASSIFFTQPACVRKTPSGWSDAQPLGARSGEGGFGVVVMSADGDRVAALYQSATSFQLFRSNRGEAWTETAARVASSAIPGQSIGFDAAGKLFQLTNISTLDQSTSLVDYLMSTEP